jgi:hypothetical protein
MQWLMATGHGGTQCSQYMMYGLNGDGPGVFMQDGCAQLQWYLQRLPSCGRVVNRHDGLPPRRRRNDSDRRARDAVTEWSPGVIDDGRARKWMCQTQTRKGKQDVQLA